MDDTLAYIVLAITVLFLVTGLWFVVIKPLVG